MQQMSLREYIDNLERDGYTVRDDHGDDPMLIRPDGCIAWTADAGETAGLADALERWFAPAAEF